MPSEMSSSVMISINSKANFDEMVSQNPGRLHVCHFATEWCAPSPQINDVLLELKNIHPELVVSMVRGTIACGHLLGRRLSCIG